MQFKIINYGQANTRVNIRGLTFELTVAIRADMTIPDSLRMTASDYRVHAQRLMEYAERCDAAALHYTRPPGKLYSPHEAECIANRAAGGAV